MGNSKAPKGEGSMARQGILGAGKAGGSYEVPNSEYMAELAF
jgi:hypothetical protein